jgi:23S rRNA (guanosine2251-2'-O)-methyltransferase
MKNTQIIFGRQPVLEAILAGKRMDKILIHRESKAEVIDQIKAAAKNNGIYVQLVADEVVERTLHRNQIRHEANHQGVLAYLSLIDYYKIEDVLPQLYEEGKNPLIIVLDGVTDVGNFGAIARSVLCLGAHAIIIPFTQTAPVNYDAIKASAGALNSVIVCREISLRRAVEFLKYNGIKIMATHLGNGTAVDEVNFTEPCAIIMGAEDTGVSRELLEKCDERIYVPMIEGFDSLNVSVTTGIVLYEAGRQRLKA